MGESPEGGVRSGTIFILFFSVGKVGGQTLLGSDLFPSEETCLASLAVLKCL